MRPRTFKVGDSTLLKITVVSKVYEKKGGFAEKRQFNINGRDIGMRLQGMGISGSAIDRMTLKGSKSKAQGCPLFLATLGPGAPHISNPNGVLWFSKFY